MSEKTTTTRWRNATPLSMAWQKFARPDLVSKYDDALTQFRPKLTAELPEKSALWKIIGAAGLDIAGQFARQETVKADMRAHLLNVIEAGELDALGYRTLPTKSNEPVIIERTEFRRHQPNWDAETFEFREFAFRDVRIAPSKSPAELKPMGRPGSGELIHEAIRSLMSEPNSDFCNVGRKIACQRVRERLSNKGVEIDRKYTGLSDVNIGKIIVIYCPKRKLK